MRSRFIFQTINNGILQDSRYSILNKDLCTNHQKIDQKVTVVAFTLTTLFKIVVSRFVLLYYFCTTKNIYIDILRESYNINVLHDIKEQSNHFFHEVNKQDIWSLQSKSNDVSNSTISRVQYKSCLFVVRNLTTTL